MDSTDDEEDALEAMRHSDLGGASMNTHEEPENERFENGVRETIEFEEALGHLNLKQKIGDGIDTKSKTKSNKVGNNNRNSGRKSNNVAGTKKSSSNRKK
tara:strand:+ start:72 stop:371 length:300 start_codon:yes stop_codon:yes gene_type:complete